MTPALQKMVEAMRAEIGRQIEAGAATLVVGEHDFPGDPTKVEIESVDLEKVARAGLEAIREPSPDIRDLLARIIFMKVDNSLFAPEHPSIQAAVDEVMPRVIDAILKETPGGAESATVTGS